MSEPRTFLIRAGVKRNYGAHEIYYEISEQVEVENGEQRRSAFINLQAQLDDQIKVYEEVSLPHVKFPNGMAKSQNPASSIDTFPISSFKIEYIDGKRRVRACGGKYLKWGVAVYPECECPHDLNALDYGEHDVKELKLKATIELENGKPVKVMVIQ